MKKITILGLMLIFALSLAGCGNKNKNDNSSTTKEKEITSINEAIGMGGKYICTFKDNGGMESKISIDNNKYKTEYTDGGKTQNSLFDGTYFYYWQSGETKGYKMSQSCLDELVEGTQETAPTNDQNEFNDELDVYSTEDDFDNAGEVNCQSVSNVDLSVPSDVSFDDQCETMRAAKQMMQNLEGQVNDIFDKVPQN